MRRSVAVLACVVLIGVAGCDTASSPGACGDDLAGGPCGSTDGGGTGDAVGGGGGGPDVPVLPAPDGAGLGTADAARGDSGPRPDVPSGGEDGFAGDVVSISGVVFDFQTEQPIAGALVSTEPAIGQVLTGDDGRYEFTSSGSPALVAHRLYRITASRAGYVTNFAQVRTEPGGNANVDIPLERAGPVGGCLTTADWDLAGDDACDLGLFWDADCQGIADGDLALPCGKTRCDFAVGICEAMEPCGAVECLEVGETSYWTARACPNDPDCIATAEEPALACEPDGFCDTWCPVRDGASVDSDCQAEGGEYCPGGSRHGECAGEVTFRAVLKDFQTKERLAGGTCYLCYDIHDGDGARAGERVPPEEMPSGAAQPLVSDDDGRITLTLPDGSVWGFECDKGAGFRTTFQFGVSADAAPDAETDLWLVSNGLYSLAPALAGLTLDEMQGVAIGRVVWPAPSGDVQPVGCAVVDVSTAGDVCYFGDNALPTPAATRPRTNPANGLFYVANIPVGDATLTASVAADAVARTRLRSVAEAISIVDLVVGQSLGGPMGADFPANPTPDDCR